MWLTLCFQVDAFIGYISLNEVLIWLGRNITEVSFQNSVNVGTWLASDFASDFTIVWVLWLMYWVSLRNNFWRLEDGYTKFERDAARLCLNVIKMKNMKTVEIIFQGKLIVKQKHFELQDEMESFYKFHKGMEVCSRLLLESAEDVMMMFIVFV